MLQWRVKELPASRFTTDSFSDSSLSLSLFLSLSLSLLFFLFLFSVRTSGSDLLAWAGAWSSSKVQRERPFSVLVSLGAVLHRRKSEEPLSKSKGVSHHAGEPSLKDLTYVPITWSWLWRWEGEEGGSATWWDKSRRRDPGGWRAKRPIILRVRLPARSFSDTALRELERIKEVSIG